MSAAQVYNTVFDGVLPKYVARRSNANDARNAVRSAVKPDVPLRARSAATAAPATRRSRTDS